MSFNLTEKYGNCIIVVDGMLDKKNQTAVGTTANLGCAFERVYDPSLDKTIIRPVRIGDLVTTKFWPVLVKLLYVLNGATAYIKDLGVVAGTKLTGIGNVRSTSIRVHMDSCRVIPSESSITIGSVSFYSCKIGVDSESSPLSFEDCTFDVCTFANSGQKNATVAFEGGCTFDQCKFEKLVIDSASTIRNSSFDQCDLASTILLLENCDFSRTTIRPQHRATFKDCGGSPYGIGIYSKSAHRGAVFIGSSMPSLYSMYDDKAVGEHRMAFVVKGNIMPVIDIAESLAVHDFVMETDALHIKVYDDVNGKPLDRVELVLTSHFQFDKADTKVVFGQPTIVNLQNTNGSYLNGGDKVVVNGATTLYDAYRPFFNLLFGAIDESRLTAVKKRLMETKVSETNTHTLMANPPDEIRRFVSMVRLFKPSMLEGIL